MPKRITIQPHLDLDQLEAHYRQSKDPVARSHSQIVWLLAQGKSTRTVAEHTGYTCIWIQTIARRYNKDGPAGLGDHRKQNTGGTPLLNAEQRKALWASLQGPPPDGGLWSGPKVAKWMSEQTGKTVHVQRGWEYMRRLGFTLQRPRPRHAKADAEVQKAFKKTAGDAGGHSAGTS
jgi:transposase